MKRMYQVNYNATYWVRASDEDEAIELAMEIHADMPNGDWEGFIDPYESPLEGLDDGTYTVSDGIAYLAPRQTGYWVATEAVQALSDVPRDGFLGVWTDPDDGKRYYDLTRHIESLDEAMAVARHYDQKAIWDNANEVAIPVN